MKGTMAALFAIVAALAPAPGFGAYVETPMLEDMVSEGKLPPVAARVPKDPRVVEFSSPGAKPGLHGGTIRMLVGGQRDLRLMTIYGYARLVCWDRDYRLVPDILESYTVTEGRIFTFKLRPGHRWSDGKPLTSEDFRYAWQDVLTNSKLSPGGLSPDMLVDGKPPKFEVIDEHTVRYSWPAPNPSFLPKLAGALPLFLAMPAHYLKQFHTKYQDPKTLEKLAKENKAKNWVSLHTRMARQYRAENPDLPTLDPWRNMTAPPSEQFIFERNPYFHRVDERGRQLPYVDRIVLNVSSTSIIPAKTGAGESDLQGRFIRFDDYTFLKEGEKRHDYDVKLYERAQGAHVALLPNLNYDDEAWQKILRDVRFRRALSLAINRREINQAVYFGLARESADTVLPESVLYRKEYAQAWVRYDRKQANALLDEVGLSRPRRDGFRRLPDGRVAEIIVETAGESTEETDVLELIRDHWRDIGIKLFVQNSQRDVFRSRIIGGKTMMGVWSGLDNGIPTPDMPPRELAPTSEAQLQWPQFGMYFESLGQKGAQPDIPEVKELVELYRAWRGTKTTEEREQIWHRMLALYTDQVFSIGIVNGTLQPVVAARNLKNVPEKGLFTFDPGAYFGIYRPDTFWFEERGE